MKKHLRYLITIAGFFGIGMVTYDSGWITGLGLFIALYTHNLELHQKTIPAI